LATKPLLVLASTQKIEHLPYWKDAQQIMVALSSNSRLIVVESGHAIHIEQPGLVAKSIREVVDAARTAQPLNQ
jgi:pimeloyl-ACP methyl ester carboxylesterase